MKIKFSLGKSIGRYSAKLCTLILTPSLLAWLPFKQVRVCIRRGSQMNGGIRYTRCCAMRQEAQQARGQERARIADFTAELAKATLALQQHVADLHPKQTNCQSCRKQVKELRTLIKRIGQILD